MRLRAHDHYTPSTLIGGKGGAGPSSLHSMLEGPTKYVCECTMDVKSTRIPTWHRMDSVSWSLGLFFKNHLLEVGLTRSRRETMALRTLTTVDLFYVISWVRSHMNRNSLKYHLVEGRSHMTSHYTRESPHYYIDVGGCVGTAGLWKLSFGLSQFHGHQSPTLGAHTHAHPCP